MRGGSLPPALLCVALGLALSFAPPRARLAGSAALAIVALATSFVSLPQGAVEIVFLGCWASAVLTAAAVHLPQGLGPRLTVGLSVNAGIWTGLVIAVAGEQIDLAKALPAVLLCIPGAWIVKTCRAIVIKIAASWVIAVSILAASLPMLPTPGYQADHME